VRGTATPAYIIVEGHPGSKATQGKPRPKDYVADNDQRVLTFTSAGYPMQDERLSWANLNAPEQ
jgi:hypothetical protein